MIINIIDKKLKTVGDYDLTFSLDPESKSNEFLLHEFNRFVLNKFYFITASTLTRSNVSVSRRKSYKQKGTGNARRGIKSSPLLRGGAVAFGPKPRSLSFKMNKKTINKTLSNLFNCSSDKLNIISSKDKFNSTKEASKFITSLKKKKVTLLISYEDLEFIKPFRNLSNISIDIIDYLEPHLFLVSDQILFTENSIKRLTR
jgi:large subunit ribosomal protein L4